MADVVSVNRNLTAVYIIEAHQKVNQCCLSAAGRPHDRNPLSRLYLQIEILDQLLVRHIAEVDVFKLYIALRVFKHLRILCIRHLRLLVDQLKDPRRAGKRILQLRHNAGNLVEGLCVLVCIA